MVTLKQPSSRLAQQVLRQVSFDDRFEGYSLRERSGPRLVTMYRFEELVAFLNDRHPRLDFDDLATWLRNVMKDKELAGHVSDALTDAQNEQAGCARVRVLLEDRLNQCREACRRKDHEQ